MNFSLAVRDAARIRRGRSRFEFCYLKNLEMASALENEVTETDSGIVLGEAGMEGLIFVEMSKLQGNGQRAKSTKICKGLNERVVRMSLNYMLKTGKNK